MAEPPSVFDLRRAVAERDRLHAALTRLEVAVEDCWGKHGAASLDPATELHAAQEAAWLLLGIERPR